MTFQRALAALTLGLVYVLIILGGWIRANNAGLSCPDWPTCYGHWVLTPGQFDALGDVGYSYYQMMLEWTHRFIAGVVVGPSILVLTVLAWRRRGMDPAGFRIAVAIMAVLLVQASLGGITVLDQNSPWSVALHLGTALLLLSLMVLVVQRLGWSSMEGASGALRIFAFTLWLLAIGTMVTAAMTAKSGASLACYEWPSCDGSYFPSLDDPLVRIHYIHRTLAALTGIGVFLMLLWTRHAGMQHLSGRVLAACVVVIVQVALGATVILLEVPRWSQSAHQATGVLLFVFLSSILWQTLRSGQEVEHSHAGLSSAQGAI
ncbi:MAG: heme A synthase [Geminicoccaceae bacterium]|nr:heme A synthase [Geminicoccaceae bacterium]